MNIFLFFNDFSTNKMMSVLLFVLIIASKTHFILEN